MSEAFMQRLVRDMGTDSTLIYDITSLSSYSHLLSILENYYNWNGLDPSR